MPINKMQHPRIPFGLLLATVLAGCFAQLTVQASTPQSKTYWGAVVEFSSEPYNQSSAARVEKAATAYMDLIESEEATLVDIIVFPESTFNSIHQAIELPEPADLIAPCNNDVFHLALQNISCSAARARKYVVINLTERRNVNNDNDGGQDPKPLYYNANVVFDREGRVISRYRKFNLFGEAGISVTDAPDISYFRTDFNVTFGHFICFDVLFKAPAMQLMNIAEVTDIVYPTMWFSELPFLTGVQAQNMWSYRQQVNFLGAGASNPFVGSTGSGIYSKQGPIKAVMSGNSLRHLIVAEIPKRQFWDDVEVQEKFFGAPSAIEEEDGAMDEQILMKRDYLDVYASRYLDFTTDAAVAQFSTSGTLCYNDLCCEYEIKATSQKVAATASSYQHFIVAFDGVRSYDGFATGGVFTCAMISCLNHTLASCGLRFEPGTNVEAALRFDAIKIEGNFRSTDDTLHLPNTLDVRLNPLPPRSYSYREIAETASHRRRISIQLQRPTSSIYTFGIYGRDFAKDGQKPSAAIALKSMLGLTIALLSLNFVLLRC